MGVQINKADFNSDIDVRMAYGAKPGSPASEIYNKMIYRLISSSEIRMLSLGSCVCECAYVGAQKLGGYLNNGTAIWDVAGAKIILTEVGIKMYDLGSFPNQMVEIKLNKIEFYSFMCFNPQILGKLLNEVGEGHQSLLNTNGLSEDFD